ncbi:hypothetical protein JD844_013863, partial [Phrynosoma platyrhinos]
EEKKKDGQQEQFGEKATEILEAEKMPFDSRERVQSLRILQEGSGNAISLGRLISLVL